MKRVILQLTSNFTHLFLDLTDTSTQSSAVDSTYTYDAYKTASSSSFATSSQYGNTEISYDASVIFYPTSTAGSGSTASSDLAVNFNHALMNSLPTKAFVTNSGSLNKYLPSILNEKRRADILFINIYFNKNGYEALRVYPAYSLPSTYDPQNTSKKQANCLFLNLIESMV